MQAQSVLEFDQRTKDDFYYIHSDITYFQDAGENFTFFTGARYLLEKKQKGWLGRGRIHIGMNAKIEGRAGKLVSRTRYERTIDVEGKGNVRERLKYYFPFSWSKYKIRPNVFNEFFFDADGFDFGRNRAGGGISAKIGKFKPEIYYFSEAKKSRGWGAVNVVGFLVKYSF